MRTWGFLLVCVAASATVTAQRVDKELVATVSAPALDGGIIAGLAWDGGTLIIQSAAMDKSGALKPGYFTTAGPRMDVRSLKTAPPAVDRYWKMKASRISPTGLGRIISGSDARMPMYGIASLEQRLQDAHAMGGTQQMHELRIDKLVIHQRTNNVEPYDGEVWGWSPPEINRIAYVDGKGDLWIARADGANAERVLRGSYTLPAWSEDGRTLAVAERKESGRTWEISVIHLAEQHRK
jgi:hypothetical protein